MRSTALESLTVLHHRLNRIGIQRTSETFSLTLHTLYDRDSKPLLSEVSIDTQHGLCLLLSLLTCSVSRVTLLPEELRRAEERTCTHLPTHNITPLVAHQWQIAPRVNPVLISIPDDGLTGRTDNQLFLQLCVRVNLHSIAILCSLQTIVSNHGTLLGESLYVLSLTREEALRNQHWEVSILHTCLLKHLVKLCLNLLPDSIAVWLDNHTTTYGRLLNQVCLYYQVIVPLRVVVCSLGHLF